MSVHKQKPLLKLLKRRYWLFCIEHGVYEVALSSLTWSTNRAEKVLNYIKDNCYSYVYVLDRDTGEYFQVDQNSKWIQISLADLVQKNQKEFEKLNQKINGESDKPPWDD